MTQYRADVDGLRAISVLGVLAFHANFPFFAGGFAGVDVFFVISGFLITGLLISEKQSTGRIDLIGFWSRRIRRLLPALAFVLFFVLLASVFLLERISGEVGSLVRASVATIFLNANHFFLIDSGNYFSELAEHNPLLHMWSLSVEEQYYLLWPLLLSVLGISKKWRLVAMIAILFALSLLLSLFWSVTDMSSAFYLMPSRAWELLAGALVAAIFSVEGRKLSESACNVMGASGLFLIMVFFVYSQGQMDFPVPAAMIPVFGAVLILIAGIAADGNFISRFLGFRPLAYIGKISYPLYLWHWPILVMMRSRRLYEESLLLDCIGLFAALLLSIFTYEMIEKKTWKRLVDVSKRRVISYGFIGMAIVLSLTMSIGGWVRFGIGYSESEKVLYSSRNDKADTGCMFEAYPTKADINRCFPESVKPSVLLWGDSHGEHWAPAIAKAAEGSATKVGVLTKGGCRPLPLSVREGGCKQFNEHIFASLESWQTSKGLKGIIIAARWADGMGNQSLSLIDQTHFKPGEYYDWTASSPDDALHKFSESLIGLVKKADGRGIKVLIVLPSPVQRYSAQHCLALLSEQKCFADLDATKRFSHNVENEIYEVAKNNSNLHVLDPKGFMCDDERCPAVINGIVAYSDDDHLTKSYALTVADEFSEELQWLSGTKSFE